MESENRILSSRHLKICIWFGPLFVIFYLLGWGIIAGYLPPSDPAATPDVIYQMYADRGVAIRVGMYITGLCAIFLVPWTVAIWAQMREIEDRLGRYPLISTLQFGSGILNVTLFLTPQCIWAATAFIVQYRPGVSPELVDSLHTVAWVLWFTTICPAIFQTWSLGYMGLLDKREKPLFPRWFCYFQFWAGLSTFPAGAIPFFNAGPFSWWGFVGCWIPVGVYGIWFAVTTYYLLKSASQSDIGYSRQVSSSGAPSAA